MKRLLVIAITWAGIVCGAMAAPSEYFPVAAYFGTNVYLHDATNTPLHTRVPTGAVLTAETLIAEATNYIRRVGGGYAEPFGASTITGTLTRFDVNGGALLLGEYVLRPPGADSEMYQSTQTWSALNADKIDGWDAARFATTNDIAGYSNALLAGVAYASNSVLLGGTPKSGYVLATAYAAEDATTNYALRKGVTTCGGVSGNASGYGAQASGGFSARANGDYSQVSGGSGACANGDYSQVSGGLDARAEGYFSQVIGGNSSVASGKFACAIGGRGNIAGGTYALCLGGETNRTSAYCAIAVGSAAVASNEYAYVWADGAQPPAGSSGPGSYTVRAAGGIRLLGGSIYGNAAGLTNITTLPNPVTNGIDLAGLAAAVSNLWGDLIAR